MTDKVLNVWQSVSRFLYLPAIVWFVFLRFLVCPYVSCDVNGDKRPLRPALLRNQVIPSCFPPGTCCTSVIGRITHVFPSSGHPQRKSLIFLSRLRRPGVRTLSFTCRPLLPILYTCVLPNSRLSLDVLLDRLKWLNRPRI